MAELYDLIQRPPTYEECLNLFLAVGWEEHITKHFEKNNLKGFFVYVVIVLAEQVVGMGRVIQRQGVYQIENIAIHPDHQGKGLGRRVMVYLMDYLRGNVDDPEAMAFLAAVEGTQPFYAQFGFKPFEGSKRYMQCYLHKPTPDD